jgi:aldehyde:ferredoxin oxidoreductase
MEIGGYAGKILYVDLTSGKISKELLDPEMAEQFIGGFGIGFRLAYDIIPPKCDALSPENAIIIGGGPFTGTPVPGAGEVLATFKAPLTGGIATGTGGGHFGFMLKSSGFDHLVISGRAPKPVYVRVFDGGAEICDASDIWGKLDGYDTVDELRSRHEPCSIIPIGPAGEHMVKISVAFIDKGGSIGYCGLPAVMGSKNLAAMVAQMGTHSIRVADRVRLLRWIDQMLEDIMSYPRRRDLIDGGTFTMIAPWMGARGRMSKNSTVKDLTPAPFSGIELDKISRRHRRTLACPGCPQGEKDRVDMPDGSLSPKIAYMTDFMRAPSWGATKIEDAYDRAIFMDDMMDRLGVCSLNWGPTRNLMVALQEQGILTKDDTGGMELSETDFETNLKLVRMTAYREGFLGDLMAEGAWRAAQKIGHGAEQQVMHIKGAAPIVDAREDSWNTMQMSNMVYPGRPHSAPGGIGIYVSGRSVAAHMREAVRIGVTEEDVERIFDEKGYNVGRLLKHAYDWYSLFNCFGQCHRLYIHRFHSIEGMVQMYSAITGIKITAAELLKKGERVWNLGRILNARCGFSRRDDRAPDKWFQPLKGTDGKEYPLMDYFGTKVITREDTEKALDDYYDESGWDIQKGVPTKKKLLELGLEDFVTIVESI